MAQRGDSPDQKEGPNTFFASAKPLFPHSELRHGDASTLSGPPSIVLFPFKSIGASSFKNSRRPEDVKYSILIEYFRFLQEQPLNPFEAPRNGATAFLACVRH